MLTILFLIKDYFFKKIPNNDNDKMTQTEDDYINSDSEDDVIEDSHDDSSGLKDDTIDRLYQHYSSNSSNLSYKIKSVLNDI